MSSKAKDRKILISVLNWNSWSNTVRCLDSLYMMDTTNFTVVVVDNGSTETAPSNFTSQYPEVLILQNAENLGFALGHKTAVDWGLGHGYDIFWILNNDLVVHPKVLSTYLEALQTYGDIALYGSLSIEGNPPVPINPGFTLDKNNRVNFHSTGTDMAIAIRKSQRSDEMVLPVATLYGCSLFLTRSLISQQGFLRNDFFMYCEEVDYALTLHAKGVPSFLILNSIVYHSAQQNNKRNLAINTVLGYYIARNTFYYRRRLGRIVGCYCALFRSTAHFVKNFMKHIGKMYAGVQNNDFEHGLAGLLGIWDALLGKKGKTLKPEIALLIGNRPFFGSYSRSIRRQFMKERSKV